MAVLLAAALWLAGAPPAPAVPTLVSVRVESSDARSEHWQPYVGLAAGDPLDPARLRHTLRLLYATGRYADVIAETSGALDHPELVIRLVPAPLLLEVRVAGDASLSPERVRRLAELRAGEPLWRARLERAARDVALALVVEGYLEARVEAEAIPRPGGADARFAVELGPRARVSAISVGGRGLDPGPRQQLRELCRPRLGQVFHRPRAAAALAAQREALAAQGRWRATVSLVEAYDPSRAVVELEFQVEPGPLMRLELEGASVPRGVVAAIEQRLAAGRADPDAVAESVDLLEEQLRSRGHRAALVRTREETRARSQVVVFEAVPGPLSMIASVSVVGLPDPALASLAAGLRPGAPLRDSELSEVTTRVRIALQQAGYPDAELRLEVAEGGGSTPVLFHVEAGAPVSLAGARFEGGLPPGAEPPPVLRPGAPYRLRDVAGARDALLGAWRDAGYLQAEVEPSIERDPGGGQARIVIRSRPGPRTLVDRIVVAGLDQTREQVVRRELRLEEGEPLGAQRVLETQRRLSALGIFQQVSVRELDPDSVGQRSVVVTATEAPRTVLSYGAGYSERDLLRANFEVTRRNLFGRARSITSFARIGFRGSRFLATYREPWFLGRRQELFVTAFREEEDRDNFDFERFGGLVQGARNLGPHWSLIGRYSYRHTRTFDVQLSPGGIDREFANSTFSGPSLSLIRDTRDDPLDPSAGAFFGADAQLSAVALGGDSFVKGFVQLASYHRLHPRLVLAGSGRLGLAGTFGVGVPRQLPLPDRFFAGGAYSLRGFPVDEVSPAGGNALLLASLELRVAAFGSLSLGAFGDAGNVYPVLSQVDLDELRYTTGLGLRYQSPFGPLRVDWAWKLNRRGAESRYRFHFAVGHAF